MKYKAKQYAAALFGALKDKGVAEQKEIISRFLSFLTKNREWRKISAIAKELERIQLKSKGLTKISVETVGELSTELKQRMGEILGGKTYFIHHKNPSLLAGIKILVDDEILIDASAKNRIDKMFLDKIR